MLYPYLSEKVRGGGIEFSAVLAVLAMVAVLVWWFRLLFSPAGSSHVGVDAGDLVATRQAQQQFGYVSTATPIQIVVEVATSTPLPTEVVVPDAEQAFGGETISESYHKQLIVGRFSRYWPPSGSANCFTDCEHFADGSRVDTAIVEGWRVVACPNELRLGTRIEFPPGSGMVWTCRDRGNEIFGYYSEAGIFIYWFDFMSEVDWVDYGSYIQVEVWVPNDQVGMLP